MRRAFTILSILSLLMLILATAKDVTLAQSFTYDAETAAQWALEHATDNTTWCATFLSYALQQGGIPIPTYVGNHQIVGWLHDTAHADAYVTQSNNGILPPTAPGDLIFMNKGVHWGNYYDYGWDHSAVRLPSDQIGDWDDQVKNIWGLTDFNGYYSSFLVVHLPRVFGDPQPTEAVTTETTLESTAEPTDVSTQEPTREVVQPEIVPTATPDDGRDFYKPWDHMVFYCKPDAVTVYVVDNNSKGHFFAIFTFKELAKAGSTGVTKEIPGLPELGVVSISMDDQGYMWAALNKGALGGDGNPDHGFAKSLNCRLLEH